MGKSAIVYRNLADEGTVGADNEISTLPATHLQEPRVSFPWQASVNTTAVFVDLGAEIEIDYVGLIGTNATATASFTVKLSTVNSSGDAGVHQSGSLSINPLYPSLHYITTPATARYVRIEMSDAALSFWKAGRLVVGKAFRPTRNFSFGWSRGSFRANRVGQTTGGGRWVSELYRQRSLSVEYRFMEKADMDANFDQMAFYTGRDHDVAFLTDIEASDMSVASLWGYLTSDLVATNPAPYLWRLQISILETL